MSARNLLASKAPALGRIRRLASATLDAATPTKQSYSQNREDLEAMRLLAGYDLASSGYIDVGANHPSNISNTYLFYRHGIQGIIVEPLPELAQLFRVFRPRDHVYNLACDESSKVRRLNVSRTPVLSSLNAANVPNPWKQIPVPVFPLDAITENADLEWVSFLSIDVEGRSGGVLRGASKTLSKTLLVCAEAPAGTNEEQEVLRSFVAADFEVISRIRFNIFAMNRNRARFEHYARARYESRYGPRPLPPPPPSAERTVALAPVPGAQGDARQ